MANAAGSFLLDNLVAVAVPEPSTAVLLATGILALAVGRRVQMMR